MQAKYQRWRSFFSFWETQEILRQQSSNQKLKELSEKLREGVTNVKELNITEETIEKETKKWKN